MAKKISAKARAAARKQRDKWKMKRWYTIRAPRHPWDFKRIGETIGESDEHIIGRVYEMTQQEFDGNFSKMHVVMRFRVTECVGQDALTTFIGHHHQTDHTRRQIRRYRGKVDDVVDVVTTDGYLVRMKPLIITQQRVQTSVKQDMRTRTRDLIIAFAAKNTYSDMQRALLDGKLEDEIEKAVKSIYPVRSVAIRKSQLLQEGVVASDGPTLDEIHAQEERQAAEMKAKKAAALAAAMAEEAGEHWVETILRLSRETGGTALFNWHMFQKSMNELKDLFTKSDHIFPSLGDAGAHVSQIMDAGWSTFILSYWHRQTGTFTMGEAIQKMTSGPAKVLGLTDRGLLAEGLKADINVFDADEVTELQPTLVNDFPGGAPRFIQRSRGFKATIVNGEISLLDGELTGNRAGQVLRHSA